MESLWLDFRYALRSLAKSPGFSLVAILTLALGIGANTTIFSIINGTLMRPLPYPNADRLAMIWVDFGEGAQSLPAANGQDFRDYQRMSELFEDFAAATGGRTVGLSGVIQDADGRPGIIDLSPVTSNFFPLLGIDPMLGRHFTMADEGLEAPRTALISHRLWQGRFGGRADIVDQSMEIDGIRHQIIGVLPEGFRLHLPAEAFRLKHSDVWTALQFDYENQTRPRNFTVFSVFGLLERGVTFAQAQSELDRIAAELRSIHPEHEAGKLRIRAVPLHEDVVKGARPALVALFVAVGFVLLIVCANVANLLLVRGAARSRELTIRAALGASKGQVVRRLLIENLMLASIGAALAVALAAGALEVLRAYPPADLPRIADIEIDATVGAFTATSALFTVLLFGILPALQGSRFELATILRSDTRSTGSRRQGTLRQLLVMTEIALSLALLVGVGLMIKSFAALQEVKPGFDPEGVLSFRLQLPQSTYSDGPTREAFYDNLEQRLQELPGVVAVGFGSQLPLSGSGPLQPYAWNEETARNWESVTADGRWISETYFETIGTTLLDGRTFTRQDLDGPPSIIIDQSLAERVWPDRSAVGQRLQVEPTGSDETFAEVIGVVEHVRMHDLSRQLQSQIYRPAGRSTRASFVVRVEPAAEVERFAQPIENIVRSIDPGLPLTAIRPLSENVVDATAKTRFSLLLMSLFGGLALLLVAIGIYGVVTFSVAQRTRELAIRLALGETPSALLLRVIRQGMKMVAIACAFGLIASVVLTRLLADLLYGVEPSDPSTVVTAMLFLGVITLVAGLIPALRTLELQPSSVLRGE